MSRTGAALTTIASVFALSLVLAGCSAPAPSGGDDADGSGGDAPAATGDFCTEFEANGGTGATIGPVQTWLDRDDVAADVQSRLDAMGDIAAPADIATEWDTMKTYYTDLLAAVEALPDGGTLMESPDFGTLGKAPEEYQAVVDYYFATC